MSQSIKVGLGALVVVVLGIAVVLHLWLGALIKAGVEQVGPMVTGTSVTLENVDIGLLAGKIQLEGLAVGNPEGFKAPTALKVGTARVRLNWRSVLSDPVVIEEITIDAPELTYEGILSKSNIDTILDHAQSAASAGPNQKSGAQPGPSAGKKFLIKELNVTNGRVAVSLGMGGSGSQRLSGSLSDIHLRDIGKELDGATAAEALSAIFGALNKAGAQAVAGAAQPMQKGAKAAAEAAGQRASQAIEGVKGLLK